MTQTGPFRPVYMEIQKQNQFAPIYADVYRASIHTPLKRAELPLET